jgi:hypothetical protein
MSIRTEAGASVALHEKKAVISWSYVPVFLLKSAKKEKGTFYDSKATTLEATVCFYHC